MVVTQLANAVLGNLRNPTPEYQQFDLWDETLYQLKPAYTSTNVLIKGTAGRLPYFVNVNAGIQSFARGSFNVTQPYDKVVIYIPYGALGIAFGTVKNMDYAPVLLASNQPYEIDLGQAMPAGRVPFNAHATYPGGKTPTEPTMATVWFYRTRYN